MTSPFNDLIPASDATSVDPFGDLIPKGPKNYDFPQEMAHQATLGLSDNAIAALQALGSANYGEHYKQALQAIQADREKYKEQQSLPSQIAGFAAGAAPFFLLPEAKIAEGAGMMARLGARAVQGGLAGAAAGGISGAAEGSSAGVPGAVEGAKQGAAAGGAFGALGGAVLPWVFGNVAKHLPGGAKREAAVAISKSAGFTRAELAAKYPQVADAIATGEPLPLAALGDPEAAASMVNDIAVRSVKGRKMMREFVATQKPIAEAAYNKAFYNGGDPAAGFRMVQAATPEMQEAVGHPSVQAALDVARQRLKESGVKIPAPPNPAILAQAQLMEKTNPKLLVNPGNAIFRDALQRSRELPVILVDRAKQVIDKMDFSKGQPITPASTDAYKEMLTRREVITNLLDAVHAQNPDYRQARATARTYMMLKQAVRAGRAEQTAEAQGKRPGFRLAATELANILLGRPYGAARGASHAALSAQAAPIASRAGPDMLGMLLTGSGGQWGGPRAIPGLAQYLAEQNLAASQSIAPAIGGYIGSQVPR